MSVGDWDRRELCSDGSCTGLIGPEGTCKVCGRAAPNWGDERKRGTQDLDEADDDDDDVAEPAAPAARVVAVGGGEWNTRALCTDGACVGLIGADGKCKVCGKPGDPSAFIPADATSSADDDDEYEDDEGDEAYEDEDDEDDEDDDELAAAADELAGIAPPAEVATAKAIADADDDRKLCPDGGCVGLIGADGKCKVCGKEAAA